MIKVLVIEDEVNNVEHLENIIEKIDIEITVVKVIGSVEQGIAYLSEQPEIDLILMDICLSDGNCFEIFEVLKIKTPIIFTTAYDEYAIKSFMVNSLDYLLKPIKKSDLEKSLDKFLSNRIPVTEDSAVLQKVSQMLDSRSGNYRSRFLLNINERFKIIDVQEIVYFYTEFRRTKALLKDKSEVILPFNIEELTQQLDPDLFFRASRQYLVSLKSIATIKNNLYSRITVKLIDGVEIDLSRERSRAIKIWLDK